MEFSRNQNIEQILYEERIGASTDYNIINSTVNLETLRSGPYIGAKEEANEHEVYN